MSGITNRQHLTALIEKRKIIRRQQTALYEAQEAILRVRAWCDELDARAAEIKGVGAAAHRDRAILTGLADQCRAAIDPFAAEESV